MTARTLYGLTAEAYQAMRGFAPVADSLERAEELLSVGWAHDEQTANHVLTMFEGVDALVAEEGPRGDGARFALEAAGPGKLEELRERAREVVARRGWERAEAEAMTGGAVEEVEA